jgi:hypothetical protein|tara:strand:+ start:321 stop:479 length:159 start_codon:yes stop_codon:yes gene_type:complete
MTIMNSAAFSRYSDLDLGGAKDGLILAHFIEPKYRNRHHPAAVRNRTPWCTS